MAKKGKERKYFAMLISHVFLPRMPEVEKAWTEWTQEDLTKLCQLAGEEEELTWDSPFWVRMEPVFKRRAGAIQLRYRDLTRNLGDAFDHPVSDKAWKTDEEDYLRRLQETENHLTWEQKTDQLNAEFGDPPRTKRAVMRKAQSMGITSPDKRVDRQSWSLQEEKMIEALVEKKQDEGLSWPVAYAAYGPDNFPDRSVRSVLRKAQALVKKGKQPTPLVLPEADDVEEAEDNNYEEEEEEEVEAEEQVAEKAADDEEEEEDEPPPTRKSTKKKVTKPVYSSDSEESESSKPTGSIAKWFERRRREEQQAALSGSEVEE